MPNQLCPFAYSDGKLFKCLRDKCELFVESEPKSGGGHCALRGLASLPEVARKLNTIDDTIRVHQ